MNGRQKWRLKPADDQVVANLAKDTGLSAVIARVLVNRRVTTADEAKKFLNVDKSHVHSPFLLKDMDRAVARVLKAIQSKEKICVYGDYDVDGAVSTSLLLLFFKEIGFPIEFYIPNRLREGYSLNKDALETLRAREVTLLITVDNGIMAHKEIAFANTLGLDVIVTDHHQVAETLPQAVAIVNPQRADCTYPFKGICGAGVAFKLIMALRQTLREQNYFRDKKEPNLKQYLDLLCIATVCDMVPLRDENRYFVKEGLKCLEHTTRPGLKALMKVSALKDTVSATDLGFRLGPRINACGRLEDASWGVKMLVSESDSEAWEYAQKLDGLNKDRRDVEAEIVSEALAQVRESVDLKERLGVVVFSENWHVGVVGIVASRVVEKIKRPVFVLGKTDSGDIKGSGRSIAKVNLVVALRECSEYLKMFGGHEAAAGLTLHEGKLDEFTRAFDHAIKKQMIFEDLAQKTLVDDDLTTAEINRRLVDELGQLEPFGMGNAKPLFVLRELKVKSQRVVGENHLKLRVSCHDQDFDAIAFNQADQLPEIEQKKEALFSLEINKYQDVERVQLVIKELF